MPWASDSTEEYDAWFAFLSEDDQEAVLAAVRILEDRGPSLGRPLVDTLTASSISNLKELRPPSSGSSELRVIFAFDPQRTAILLVGGDKAGNWTRWYPKAIAEATTLFNAHLEKLERQRKEAEKQSSAKPGPVGHSTKGRRSQRRK